MRRSTPLVLLLVGILVSIPAAAQLAISTPDGSASLKLGVLAQPQAEWLENPDGSSTAQNLFVRRIRLLVGGKVGERFTLFLDTDSPNLGKAGADGKRTEATMYVQDLVLTYQISKSWKLDAGKLLVAQSYHSGQGATTLLGLDYGPYAFITSTPMGLQGGRDYGVAGRGYLAGNHLEVRAGVYQGVRGPGASNPFRTAARVVWYPWDAQADFFYPGTAFGKKKVLGIGVSHDRQKDYRATGADVYLDLPVGGNVVTAQVNAVRLDGGDLMPTLAEQDTLFVEAGTFVRSLKIEPYLQYSRRNPKDRGAADEQATQVGLAYWHDGHRLNVKLGVGKVEKEGAPDRLEVVLQGQLFLF
ncbi:MAG TPA: porin [Thermoanaerobaculaceae bacterium]|nr:porin [Thermoanaerobaculaceae bacterium]HPS78565.1 porin [Thermoanaerobaculaceae bacterium]